MAERAQGGWVFASAPGTRPEPFTLVVKTAEHWLGPLGLAGWDLVVVRSPGTPAAGLVLVEGYRRTGRDTYLAAARRAGDLLLATQLAPGGWFSELPVYGDRTPWWFRATAGLRPMLDDDITPGATRFLLALWEVTGEPRYRAGAERGIDLLRRSQLASGAWPLDARPEWLRRAHPHYEDQPALNDGATPFAVTTLIAASATLGRPELLAIARRAGNWLVTVQGRPPAAAWAQQYDAAGRPSRARAFELPALATWETRHAIEALVALAAATGDRRYCAAASSAADWLARVRIGPACWARFHDLTTGAPIYVDGQGTRVATSVEARPGYSWMGDFGIPWLLARLGFESGSPPHRLPGDPGSCPQDPRPPRPLAGARALTAQAAVLLAAESPPVDLGPCAR
ncbi:MAG TPA: hypothetical protein VMS22_21735 [Candidatus Eisenbacteria bacterium]|nr:hypothetical protein [Candidatus Eisenbacteria bacterium]